MNIGIIGYGNMGAAIAGRIRDRYQVTVFDKDQKKTAGISGVTVAASTAAVFEQSQTVILAVKPQDFEALMPEALPAFKTQLIVSIMAGIPTAYIEARLPAARVIRAMPNLCAVAGMSMTGMSKGAVASNIDMSFVQSLFNKIGRTIIVEEPRMNALTAVSGSGPGFLFCLIKALPRADWQHFSEHEFVPQLSRAAQEVGFGPEQSLLLAQTTAAGSFALLEKTRSSPDILCLRVTSKGGTTEAGLKALNGSVENLGLAVKAALLRAEELSKK